MYDRLIVPIGDDDMRTHLGPAEGLARLLSAPIELLTVQSPGLDTDDTQVELEALRVELDVPTVPPRVIESNDAAGAIAQHLLADRRSLLCMGTHGRGALGAAVLGSIASEVVRLVHDPFVLVGPSARPPNGKEILVGVRPNDPHAPAVVDAGAQLARAVPEMSLHLVSVGACSSLPALAECCNASFDVVSGGAAADRLVWLASERDVALLVVGTHARTGIGRMLLGSVSERVVRDACVPVLVVPPPAVG